MADLSYHEFTGYDSYCSYYDGYTDVDIHEPSNEPHVTYVLDTSEDQFDTCAYTVASW